MQPEQVASPERCRAKRNKREEQEGREQEMKRQIEQRYEEKDGRTWKMTYRTEDPEEIYKGLAQQLLSHKVFHASYIKRMEQHNNYDGTRTVTFYEDNGGRRVYIIEAR